MRPVHGEIRKRTQDMARELHAEGNRIHVRGASVNELRVRFENHRYRGKRRIVESRTPDRRMNSMRKYPVMRLRNSGNIVS